MLNYSNSLESQQEYLALVQYRQALLQLQEAKRNNPLEWYIPHAKQALAWNSACKEQWVYGGNRAGKTENNIAELARMLQGTHPSKKLRPRADGGPWLIWLCSQDGEIQRDVLQQKWDRFIPKEWIVKQPQRNNEYIISCLKIYNSDYGWVEANITWKTYDSKDETFESASVDAVVCDEEPPKSKYNAITARLFDSGAWGNGWFLCALTPVKGEGWSIEEIFDKREARANTLVIEYSTYDNAANLGGVERVKSFELSLPEEERPARIYGRAKAKQGLVLEAYVDELFPAGHLLLPFRPDWSRFTPYESIDYGFSAPMSVGFYAVGEDGTVIKYDEIYVKRRTIPFVKGLIYHKRKHHGYRRPRQTYIDPTTGNTESTGIRKIDQFPSKIKNVWVGQGEEPSDSHRINLEKRYKTGRLTEDQYILELAKWMEREGYISYSISVSPAKNKRGEGWDILNEYLAFDERTGRPKTFVTTNCTETRREARRLKWKLKQGGGVTTKNEVSGDDHACDEWRYMTCARPQFIKGFNPNPNLKEKRRHVRTA